jgi:hypothetical protein
MHGTGLRLKPSVELLKLVSLNRELNRMQQNAASY